MKRSMSVVFILSLIVLQGCATSYGRQNDLVRTHFKADALQASVSCHGEAVELPGNLRLKRSSSHDCIAQAPGYEVLKFRVWTKLSKEGFDYSTSINWQKWSKWTLGLGHLIAWPIDFISGSMKDLESDHYELRLRPSEEVSIPAKVLDQTMTATQKVIAMPSDAVEEVSSAIMNSTVQASAGVLGFASDEDRASAEQVREGQAVIDRLQASE